MATISGKASIGIVGCGYWGKNHVRCFRQLGVLRAIADVTPAGREVAAQLAPEAAIYHSPQEMLKNEPLDGVVIATPAETHFELAAFALENGKHVLVEKPLALQLQQGIDLLRLADSHDRILMVGHLLEYHPAVLALRSLIADGLLGRVRYVYSNRLNLGKIRREENILWSFAPHDIAVILRLVGTLPYEVVAAGGTYIQANIPDVTVTQLLFDNGVRAHIFVSWLHPYKEQRLVVVGSERMAVFDDVTKSLRLFDQRVEWQHGQPIPIKNGADNVPYPDTEPLLAECRDFLHAIATGQAPTADALSGVRVLSVLHSAQRSVMLQGEPTPVRSVDTFGAAPIPSLA